MKVPTPPPAAPTPPKPVVAKPAGPQLIVGPNAASPDMLKVALLVPLSGPQADAGQGLANAAEMAVSEMGNSRIALLPIDTAGGAKPAVTQALAQGSSLILGPLFASDVLAAAPAARDAHVPMISFSSDATVAGEGVYVVGFLPREQASRVATYAAAHNLHKFAILASDTNFGHQMADAFRQALINSNSGASLVRTAFYGSDITRLPDTVGKLTDYDTRKAAYASANGQQATAAPATGIATPPPAAGASASSASTFAAPQAVGQVPFDALFIAETGPRLHQILALLQQEDVDLTHLKLLGPLLWSDPDVQKDPLLNGAWYAAPPFDSVKAFEDRYQKLYGGKPPAIAALGYDTAALASVLAKAGGAQPFSPEALAKPAGFAGTDGLFRFLPDGTAERGFAVMEIHPPTVTIIDPALDQFTIPAVTDPMAQPPATN